MALTRRNRTVAQTATAPPDPAPEAFPQWALSSVMEFLAPFVRGEGGAADDLQGRRRSFLREVERNLKQPLNWRSGEGSAWASLLEAAERDPSLLVDVVDFALRNILLGAWFQNSESVAAELDRALRESGAMWRVGRIEGTVNYRLERRSDPAASAALTRITRSQEGSGHLSAAWDAAYGRDPNPGRAYGEAIKAVEEAAIPVVSPNDKSATLGKVIGALRATPTAWDCIFTRDSKLTSGATLAPIEVVIAMLDLLWVNQTDRHAPIESITQPQAESAVQLALGLVEIFRSGAISKR